MNIANNEFLGENTQRYLESGYTVFFLLEALLRFHAHGRKSPLGGKVWCSMQDGRGGVAKTLMVLSLALRHAVM